MILDRILSGGQTGADQAGLRAARRLGIPTGGHAPRGWKTLDGPAPWLADYGLVESAWDYPGRTKANVRDADATVRFARDFITPGEMCTLRAIMQFNKPALSIQLQGFQFVPIWPWSGEQPADAKTALLRFLDMHCVRVLNVAGNSEKTAPGIGAVVEAFLIEALARS